MFWSTGNRERGNGISGKMIKRSITLSNVLSLRLFSQISGMQIKLSIILSHVLSLRSFSQCLTNAYVQESQQFHTIPVIKLLLALWIKYILIIWIAKSLHLKIKQPTAPMWIYLLFRIFSLNIMRYIIIYLFYKYYWYYFH